MYLWLTVHKAWHDGNWPKEYGQRFLLGLWQDGIVEHTEKNAKRFFSAAEPFVVYSAIMGMEPGLTAADYLSDGGNWGPDTINYAGFDPGDHPELVDLLKTDPAKVTIVANSTFAHREVLWYMTADGDIHQLRIEELLASGQLSQDDLVSGLVPLGPESSIPELRSVSGMIP